MKKLPFLNQSFKIKKIELSYVIIISLILIASFSRLIPHIPNFTPVGAIALFGGAYLENKYHAFLIPIASLWLSDLFLNNFIYSANSDFIWFYSGFFWQYISFIIITSMGYFFLKKLNLISVSFTLICSSLLFFIVTNFGVWISGTMYTLDLQGLITCYLMALPFFKGTFLGFITYSLFLFGVIEFSKKKFQILKV